MHLNTYSAIIAILSHCATFLFATEDFTFYKLLIPDILLYYLFNTVEPRVSGQKVVNLLFSFTNNLAYRDAIRLSGHSTEDFFLE